MCVASRQTNMTELWRKALQVRLSTAFPFTLGLFSGTLLITFLSLALWAIEDEPSLAVVRPEALPNRSPEALQLQLSSQLSTVQDGANVSPRRRVSYNIPSAKQNLKKRILAAHRTWAHGLEKDVRFFLFPQLTEEESEFALRKEIPVVQIAKEKGIIREGVFSTWKSVCETQLPDYHWFVKLQDNTYVRTESLEKLLLSMNSSVPLLIGIQIVPYGYNRDILGLKEGESYCMEMGYAVSWRALELLCPVLPFCKENAKSENEDVEIARCLRSFVGVNCTQAREMQEFFYKAEGIIAEEELQIGQHHLNPVLKKAVLLSPLQEPQHFYHLHHYYSLVELNVTKSVSKGIKTHMVSSAEMVTHSSQSPYMNDPLWAKLSAKLPYLPPQVEELIHWTAFDTQFLYTESSHLPSSPLPASYRAEINSIVKSALQISERDSIPSDVRIESIHQRIDVTRGLDYFIHLLRKINGIYVPKFYHVFRESEAPKVLSLNAAMYRSTKVNFVVPTPAVSKAFQRFMISFENNFLARNPPEHVGLLVILYSDGKIRQYSKDMFAAFTLLDLYKKKYPSADLRVVSTQQEYTRREYIQIAYREFPTYELLFLADVHVDYSQAFLQRCRMNSIEGQQVYFPIAYSPFSPAEFYKNRIKSPLATRFQLKEFEGSWMQDNYHLVCLYNYDLERALSIKGGKSISDGGWNLLDLFLEEDEIKIFRAPEPGLVHLWQDSCKEEGLGQTEQKLCSLI